LGALIASARCRRSASSIPAVSEPRRDFADFVEPIRIALEQERKVTEQISQLTAIAREEGDYVSEQFNSWFLKEQVEEIDLFSSLLAVAERSRERPMDVEDYIAREGIGGDTEDPTAPPVAGG
jgi:ferritin